MDPLPLTIIIVVLVLLSGFFSGTETAYSCANRIKLKSMVMLGKKNAKAVYKFADENYDKLVTTILIGNNIVNLTASALGTVLFTKLLLGTNVDPTSISTIVLTVVVLLFGEITPKYFASVYPEKCCFLFYPLMQLFYWILFPFGKIFDGYKAVLAKVFKLKKDATVTDAELMSLVDEAEEDGTLKEDESELVRSALEFDDLKVEDILVPRVDVFAVEEKTSMEEVREVFKKTGYSRLPVYQDTIDNVIGLIHERDFYNGFVEGEKEIGHLVQEIVFTTEYTRISTLLKQLQKKKIHMAAVSDEYGGLVGIVTLEDILEQLVGEIWDEHDEEITYFKEVNENTFIVDSKVPLSDFFEFFNLSTDEDTFEALTVSGWVIEQLGEIPKSGSSLEFENLRIDVTKATVKRIQEIKVTKLTNDKENTEDK